jgi:phenylacetate-coenzyme A ligase PaaK-like adenylate-forming protein
MAHCQARAGMPIDRASALASGGPPRRTHAVRSDIRDMVETRPSQDMEPLQVERLRAGLSRLSKRGPFDREKRREMGVTADSIRSRKDLTRLPVTRKVKIFESPFPRGYNHPSSIP